jgi:fermentation-respiration switch protein FrsA (DUF1100 family)
MKVSLPKLAAVALLIVLLGTVLPTQPAQAQTSAAPAATCATTVTVQAGDTLSTIAARTLGSMSAYPRIVAATNAAAAGDGSFPNIVDPNQVRVGWKLCLPTGATAPAATASLPVAGTQAAPAATPAPTAVPAAVPTTTESQRPPIDPVSLTLTWLAQQETPGSDITVEQVLAPGNNYDRYLVSYLSEGLRINAYMTVPQGAQPATGWPAVVFNHGYIPPTIYRSTERYIAYQDAFARNGYIVFRPDYRGHAFSEGEATGAYGSPGYTIDVLNALASVKADPRVDANRIGMWGHSLGGYITLRAMVVNDDIKAGVIWAGVVGDYADMLENWRRNPSVIPTTIPQSARRWRDDLVAQMGTPAENPVYWNSISANSYLNTLSGPVQLHHGTADEDVPVDFSRTLQEEIEAAGGMVEYFEYADDNHNLSNSLYVALERSVAFFDQYVKNATP